MTELVGAIGASITMAKGLYEICKEYDNSILLRQLSDLNLQLAQTQTEAAQMMDELRNLRADAEEQANNPLEYTGIVYQGKDGFPYCPACYDDRRKRIHLKDDSNPDTGYTLYICPVCKEKFEGYDEDD